MTNTPLVSVIIPNYNHARYLDQRLQTVLGQTYQNFEVIILDDKSTDNSLDVIAKYKDNPHVSQVVVNEQNSGSTFKQWDKGIHLAKGEVIWIAESDDYCELNMLEELVKAYVKKERTVLAYTTLKVVDDNGQVIESEWKDKNQYYTGKQYIRRYLTLANFVRNASGAIFSKEAALRVNPQYKNYHGAGDYLFWVEICLLGNVAIVNQQLSYFRRHNGVVTNKCDTNGVNFSEEKKILDYIYKQIHISWLRQQGISYYHQSRILSIQHDSKKIFEDLKQIWDIKPKFSFIQKVVKKIEGTFRKRNIYL